mmetsp:Transcript_28216/g.44749  ORF Transcript_28216/g.44749 Transcript_28216/m.44749 type:complete len:244 (-) Transcript_28216:42-773(-)
MGVLQSLVLESGAIEPLKLASRNYTVKNCDDNVFDDVMVGENRKIIGKDSVLKLVVLKSLVLEQNAMIACNGGSIILDVAGDVHLKTGAQIRTCGNKDGGEIMIKCNNLILGKNASIKTCNIYKECGQENIDFEQITQDFVTAENKMSLFGNLSISVQHKIILKESSMIQSGEITLRCGGSMTVQDLSAIVALRGDLHMNVEHSLTVNPKTYQNLQARKTKNITHSKLVILDNKEINQLIADL